MVNFLALLGWHPEGNEEILSSDDLIAQFDITKVQKGGAHFDEAKLLHINQEWMRRLSDSEFVARFAKEAAVAATIDTAMLPRLLPLLRERSHTFKEARDMLAGELAHLFSRPTADKEKLLAKEPEGRSGLTKSALETLLKALEALPEGVSVEAAKEALMPIAEAEEAKGKGGRGSVLHPLRYALSGAERSPDPFTLISVLGPKEAASRVATAIAILD
jgi:glutamyl/glutaminyl-tRNA synthetase